MSEDASPVAYVPGVSVAVLHDGRFLLVRRGREPSKGLYAFPGGRVQEGESDEDAVRRELAEETGLALDRVEPLRQYLIPSSGGHPAFRLVVFRGEGPTGTLAAGDDAAAAGWFSLQEMETLPIIPSVLETARAIAAERRLP
jgi:ADP-ribose pyrophosphatase YjhB (NUDIX family)